MGRFLLFSNSLQKWIALILGSFPLRVCMPYSLSLSALPFNKYIWRESASSQRLGPWKKRAVFRTLTCLEEPIRASPFYIGARNSGNWLHVRAVRMSRRCNRRWCVKAWAPGNKRSISFLSCGVVHGSIFKIEGEEWFQWKPGN